LYLQRQQGAWLLRPLAAVFAGGLAWAVPMVAASGGIDGYIKALGSQAGEDFAWADMLWAHPAPRAIAVALYDTFAQPEADHAEIGVLIDSPRARRAAVYTWNFHPELIETAIANGASGYLSKTLPAHALVAAIEAIHSGELVVSPDPGKARVDVGLEWPGKSEGLSNRESEILALITQGLPNVEIARLTYLSPNTIKSYVRSAYRKIGVTSRTQAVLWGIEHGFRPDHRRIDHWRDGP
jgi:DNA-binding NarL/FixJ family response regulator